MTRPLVIVVDADLDNGWGGTFPGALAVVNRGGWTYNVHTVTHADNPDPDNPEQPSLSIGPVINCRTVIPAADHVGLRHPTIVPLAEAVETAAEILADLIEEEPTL